MSYADDLLEEFLKLETEVKEKTRRLEEIKSWCRERGAFTTQRFVCSLPVRERTSLAPLDEVAAIVGRDTLERYNLIRKTEFRIVQVSRK